MESSLPSFPSSARLLSQASKQDVHLDDEHPIFVKHGQLTKSDDEVPPEYHPYLEFAIRLSGQGQWFADNETVERRPYDIFLGSINQPHWGSISSYPVKFITVYFLPNILSQQVGFADAMTILDRFLAPQPLSQRLIRPPVGLRAKVVKNFQEMAREFDQHHFGCSLRLQSLLIITLIDILRWERKSGHVIETAKSIMPFWRPVTAAMAYIRQHFDQPIYAKEVAAAAGLSESRLRLAFRETLKMPWIRYLESYRVHRACLILKMPGSNVTETALAVGFESLSHFNRSFKTFIGCSPRAYVKKNQNR